MAARSLNRAVFVIEEQGERRQLRGYPDLGSPAVWERTLAWADANGLDCADGLQIERQFFAASDDPTVQAVADWQGRRLGHLLLALKQGRVQRDDWLDAHHAFWRGVERVVVGGGRTVGWFGERLVAAAQTVLQDSGLRLEKSVFSAELTHIGLARLTSLNSTHALLFDFGQTSIKCAVASFSSASVERITPLFSTASRCHQIEMAAPDLTARAALRWDSMIDLIGRGVGMISAEKQASLTLSISLATYLQDGNPPALDQGCYGVLQHKTANLAESLQAAAAKQF